MQMLFLGKIKADPAVGIGSAIEIDLGLPAGPLPTRLSHRLAYDLAPGIPMPP